jgi:hypothetical protein
MSKYLIIPLLLLLCTPAGALTLEVDCGDDLQQILDSATDGDVLVLAPGSYPGGVVVDKAVKIRGAGEDTVVGDASDSSGLSIDADNVIISDLKVIGEENSIIINGSASIQIEDCILEESQTGLLVRDCEGCLIKASSISTEHTGIQVETSTDISIVDNAITAPAKGVFLLACENITVAGNRMRDCEVGRAAESLILGEFYSNELSGLVGGLVFITSEDCSVRDNTNFDVLQYIQFFTSRNCTIHIEDTGGVEYIAADIFSDNTYNIMNYSITGRDYALIPAAKTVPSGYLGLERVINITFPEVSLQGGYVFIQADHSEVPEGYDVDSVGIYRLDSSPELMSAANNESLSMVAVLNVSGNYALLVKKETNWMWTLVGIIFLLLMVGAVFIYGKKGIGGV